VLAHDLSSDSAHTWNSTDRNKRGPAITGIPKPLREKPALRFLPRRGERLLIRSTGLGNLLVPTAPGPIFRCRLEL